MPVDESRTVRSERRRRRRRVYRRSDSAEAAAFLRSRGQRRPRGVDTAEAARARELDTITRLETRRTSRDVGGPVLNRRDLGAFLATLRRRREEREGEPEFRLSRGRELSEKEREENERQIMAEAALRTLGPDIEKSAAATKQRFGLAARQIRDAIIGTPAGVYEAGKAVGFDVRDIATGRDVTPSRTKELSQAMAHQIAEDIRHPEENPGFLLLDLFAAASLGTGGATRLSAAGRAARAAAREGRPGRAASQALVRKPSEGGSLLRRPAPERVELASGIHRNLSRNPLVAALQADRIERMRARPEGVSGGRVPRILRGRNLAETVGRERRRREQILADVDRAEAEGLRTRGKRLSDVESTAVRTVGERTSVEARLAAHRRDLAAVEGKGPSARLARRRLSDKIALLKEVKRQGLVVDADGTPQFEPGSRLAKLYERAVASTGRREAIIEELGLASREQLVARRAAPARVIEGATFERMPAQTARREQVRIFTDEAEGEPGTRRTLAAREERAATARLVGAEETPAGDLYIPYGRRRIKISHAQVGSAQGIGRPRKPQSLTRQFTGRSIQTGRFRDDAVTAVAEAELEIVRYRSILRVREEALRESIGAEELVALPARVQDHYVPVRVTGKPYSPDTREFLETLQGKVEEGVKLTRKERKELERRGDVIRSWAFPDMDTQQALAAAAKGEVRFVDNRRLGGLNEPEAVGGGRFRTLGTLFDEINSAQQIAILFLKPAYLTPNLIGQTALSLIQQGPAAPWNLAKSVALYRKLSPEDQAKVRAGIGQGFAQSLEARRGRVFTPTRNVMARGYSKILDSPFRWPAFLHEARLLGYDSPGKIRQLLNDAAKRDDMVEVFKRTRDAMIDYSDLGPWEQRLIRRVIFFYPWVKGSSVYTARFARDRPAVATGLAQLGRYGTEKAERELGPGPWYGRGTFKVGGTEERPTVVNPRAAALFESPVQAIEALTNLVQGKPREAGYKISDFLSPAAQLPFQIERPHDPLLGYELPVTEALKRQYVENLPQARLVRELQEPTEGREDVLYPTSRRGAVAKFGVGTIFPRPLNRPEWQERASEEALAGLDPAERAYRKVFAERTAFWEAAKQVAPHGLENGRLPADLRQAFGRKAEVERERARIDADTDRGVDRDLAKFEAEIRLLGRWGVLPSYRVGTALRWAQSASWEEIVEQRRRLTSSSDFFKSAYLERILRARKALQELGAELE